MSKPILVGYDPRRADYAPVEFGAELARLTGAPQVLASERASSSGVLLGTEVASQLSASKRARMNNGLRVYN